MCLDLTSLHGSVTILVPKASAHSTPKISAEHREKLAAMIKSAEKELAGHEVESAEELAAVRRKALDIMYESGREEGQLDVVLKAGDEELRRVLEESKEGPLRSFRVRPHETVGDTAKKLHKLLRLSVPALADRPAAVVLTRRGFTVPLDANLTIARVHDMDGGRKTCVQLSFR